MPTGEYKRTEYHRQRQLDGWVTWRTKRLETMTSKVCAMCNLDKPIDQFYKRYQASWYSNCKECEKERRKQYKATTARSAQKNKLRGYNMTFEDYERLYDSQEGLCMICQQPNNRDMLLAVDHDHATGKVRGLLCNNCNLALGLVHDDPHLLRRMAEYIEELRGA